MKSYPLTDMSDKMIGQISLNNEDLPKMIMRGGTVIVLGGSYKERPDGRDSRFENFVVSFRPAQESPKPPMPVRDAGGRPIITLPTGTDLYVATSIIPETFTMLGVYDQRELAEARCFRHSQFNPSDSSSVIPCRLNEDAQ